MAHNGFNSIDVDEVAVVVLAVEHDLATSPSLVATLEGTARPGSRVVVDLTAATFIDSTALRALLTGAQDADRLAIVASTGASPRRLLDMTNISCLYPVVETREQALGRVALAAGASAFDLALDARAV
jgi:anti-anti-sigma factor